MSPLIYYSNYILFCVVGGVGERETCYKWWESWGCYWGMNWIFDLIN